jgi:hypothetical protein
MRLVDAALAIRIAVGEAAEAAAIAAQAKYVETGSADAASRLYAARMAGIRLMLNRLGLTKEHSEMVMSHYITPVTDLSHTTGSAARPRTKRLAHEPWTVEDVLALGVRADLVTVCQIVYGCGKNRAWELYHSGQLGFPALKVGRRVVVPMAPVLALLGIETQAAS